MYLRCHAHPYLIIFTLTLKIQLDRSCYDPQESYILTNLEKRHTERIII